MRQEKVRQKLVRWNKTKREAAMKQLEEPMQMRTIWYYMKKK